MAVMFLFYANTENDAWRILTEIPVHEFTNVRHKVSPAYKTTKRDRFVARLFILHPLNKYLIDLLDTEFTTTYTGRSRYIGYCPLTYSVVNDIGNMYVLMLLDAEREEIEQLVRRYDEYDHAVGFTLL